MEVTPAANANVQAMRTMRLIMNGDPSNGACSNFMPLLAAGRRQRQMAPACMDARPRARSMRHSLRADLGANVAALEHGEDLHLAGGKFLGHFVLNFHRTSRGRSRDLQPCRLLALGCTVNVGQ